VRLDSGYYLQIEHSFNDSKGNTVKLSPASKEFLLSYFESDRYEVTFERMKTRLQMRAARGIRRGHSKPFMRFEELIPGFHTIKYCALRKPRGQNIYEVAVRPIKACLFALAFKKDESWELSHEIKSKGLYYPQVSEIEDENLEIPRAS